MICSRIWAPLAGITSTMIIVRVALGISFNDTKSTIMTLRKAETIDEPTSIIDNCRQTRRGWASSSSILRQ
ncbi:hypothetical protein WG66_007257 [Moniliophthora roreri]|nr:hypothetical protein WG66_007257 [Moniliophthora roreri]